MRTAFHHIAYQSLPVCNALSWSALRSALATCDLQPGQRLLDIGCGYGQVAIAVAQTFQAQVTAVELDPVMAMGAERNILDAGLQDQIELRQETSAQTLTRKPDFDLILALGTTHPVGPDLIEPKDVFSALSGHLVPGGHLVWGDLVWTSEPPEPLRQLVETGGYYVEHDAWQQAALEAGLEVVSARLSPDEEWPPYLDGMRDAVRDWLDQNPDHADADRVANGAKRVGMMFEFGADHLGFGLNVFRKPA